MRIIVPGSSTKECQRRVNAKKKEGWKQITNVKQDPSPGEIRWVCVMEKPDDPKKKNHKWNHKLPLW